MVKRISNGVIIQGGSINASTTTYYFNIAFTSNIWGMSFSQSGAQSAYSNRIAFGSYPTLTGFTLDSFTSASTNKGAYYIAVGY